MNLRLTRQSERNQTFQKVHVVWFSLYKTLENTNYKPVYRKTADRSLVALGSVKLYRHTRKLMGVMDILTIRIVMMVSWVHMYVNLIVSFKYYGLLYVSYTSKLFKKVVEKNWNDFLSLVIHMNGTRCILSHIPWD